MNLQYHDINSKLEEVTCLLDRIMTMDGKDSSNDFASKDNLSDSGKMKKESRDIDKFEEIKKLKELLDMDIISQEEFNKKKVELLNL